MHGAAGGAGRDHRGDTRAVQHRAERGQRALEHKQAPAAAPTPPAGRGHIRPSEVGEAGQAHTVPQPDRAHRARAHRGRDGRGEHRTSADRNNGHQPAAGRCGVDHGPAQQGVKDGEHAVQAGEVTGGVGPGLPRRDQGTCDQGTRGQGS